MEHYVTLFDSLFLPQGLALHASLERHAGDYTLWVVCMDEQTRTVLERLQLQHLRLINLADIETPELQAVKSGRSKVEYYWTLTPFTPKFVFERDPSVTRVTYVDADLWLRQRPYAIFKEFEASGKSVFITEHAFAPEYDISHRTGKYCVQFMIFVRERSETVRRWWADRCIEWCFGRTEDGKFGDQKYLDDWPERFGNEVHVLRDKELFQAPWNASRFPPSGAAAFHFHGLRLMRDRHVLLCGSHYTILPSTLEIIYRPYLKDLQEIIRKLSSAGFAPGPQVSRPIIFQRLDLAVLRCLTGFRNLTVPRIHRLQE